MKRNGRPPATYLDDVIELLEYGETPAQIAARIARKPATIARHAYRHAKPEIARQFERIK